MKTVEMIPEFETNSVILKVNNCVQMTLMKTLSPITMREFQNYLLKKTHLILSMPMLLDLNVTLLNVTTFSLNHI